MLFFSYVVIALFSHTVLRVGLFAASIMRWRAHACYMSEEKEEKKKSLGSKRDETLCL